MSDSSLPQGLQPTGLLHPWDFLGKNTGVGCHCLLCISILAFKKKLIREVNTYAYNPSHSKAQSISFFLGLVTDICNDDPIAPKIQRGTHLTFVFNVISVLSKFYFILFLKGEGNGDPLQYSLLENPMGRGA